MSLVYSTGKGRLCSKCGEPVNNCQCNAHYSKAKSDGTVRVGRSTKGRKGKGVSVITGLPLRTDELKALAKELKQKCGTGGTVKDRAIEIQGEHRDVLVEELKKRGFQAKRSGG